MTLDRTKATAFASVLVLLIAYLAIYRPAEARIAERYLDLDRETQRLQQRLAAARRAPDVERERNRLRAQLDAQHLRDDRARLVQRFLLAAAATARRRDLHILEITSAGARPVRRAGTSAPSASPPSTPLFDEVPLNVTMRGSYAGLVRGVRDLCTSSLAVRLSIESLVVRDRRLRRRPELTATIHVTLLRDIDDPPLRPRPS